MEPSNIDPYAPPEAALTGTETTTYLQEDGYAFQNELVANSHFKSPLICAKLGIPIPPESIPEPKLITVTRESLTPKSIKPIITLISFLALISIVSYLDFSLIIPAIIVYSILASILNRLFSKPYQVPFYFSEKYTRRRSNLIYLLISILIASALVILSGILTNHAETIGFASFAFIITVVILKYKTTYFVVTMTKGDYHYIRGVHQNLLNTLPHLPLSS